MPKTLFFTLFLLTSVCRNFAKNVETLGFLDVDQSKNAVIYTDFLLRNGRNCAICRKRLLMKSLWVKGLWVKRLLVKSLWVKSLEVGEK